MTDVVRVADYADAFRSVVPGAELRPAAQYGGVTASWSVRVDLAFGLAPNSDRAVAMVTQLAEQMRLRAIRELGLEPILEAQRAEVCAFKEANVALQATCDARASRIAYLEEELDTVLAEQRETP